MTKKESCHLCSLPSDFLPHRHKAERGVSCKRCGDYYIDDLLVECGEPTNKEEKAILSGYTRWQKELGNPIPEINAQNIERIIEENKKYSDEEKVDKLLLFYSKRYPDRGSFANYDLNLDYSITYSKNSDELLYLLQKVADEYLGLIKVKARGVFQILPEGWKKIKWLEGDKLAKEKFDLESRKIDSKAEWEIMNLKEKSHITGNRYSSGLARKIKDVFLEGSKNKIEKKLEIDKKIILGVEVVSKTDDINILFNRINDLAEFEKKNLIKKIKDAYEDCHARNLFEADKEVFVSEIDDKTKELFIYLQAEKLEKSFQRLEKFSKDKMLKEKKSTLDDSKRANPKKVFVVHGRNEFARKAMFEFLRSIDIQPIEWGEAVKATKKASPYIGEILDNAFSIAQAIVVLFTGDDIVRLREEYVRDDDPTYERILTPQARTNVIFEAGLAFGTHPDRTILVQFDNEKTRPFSDIYGRHFIKLSNSTESRFELISRLEIAKCEVNYRGRKDWMKAGDFDIAVVKYKPYEKNSLKERLNNKSLIKTRVGKRDDLFNYYNKILSKGAIDVLHLLSGFVGIGVYEDEVSSYYKRKFKKQNFQDKVAEPLLKSGFIIDGVTFRGTEFKITKLGLLFLDFLEEKALLKNEVKKKSISKKNK